MNQRTRLWLLLTLALLGTAVGAYLAYIAWSPGLTAYCTRLGDCPASRVPCTPKSPVSPSPRSDC